MIQTDIIKFKQGDQDAFKNVYVYFDRYTSRKYGTVRSKDMITWKDVSDLIGELHLTGAFCCPLML